MEIVVTKLVLKSCVFTHKRGLFHQKVVIFTCFSAKVVNFIEVLVIISVCEEI